MPKTCQPSLVLWVLLLVGNLLQFLRTKIKQETLPKAAYNLLHNLIITVMYIAEMII